MATGLLEQLRDSRYYYAVARFETVRKAYSWTMRRLQSAGLQASPVEETLSPTTIFPALALDRVQAELTDVAVAPVEALSAEMTEEILEFARTTPCRRPGYHDETFVYTDVADGRLSDGRPVAMIRIREAEACPAVRAIARDPKHWELATRYLGYKPRELVARLQWSVACNHLTMNERLNLTQAVYFHYDAVAWNSFYINYYLTDTDHRSGAHVVIRRSHRDKPLPLLIRPSTRECDQDILKYYEPGSEYVVEGAAGSGFAEDVNCFHKALVPETHDRLHLHVRYV